MLRSCNSIFFQERISLKRILNLNILNVQKTFKESRRGTKYNLRCLELNIKNFATAKLSQSFKSRLSIDSLKVETLVEPPRVTPVKTSKGW